MRKGKNIVTKTRGYGKIEKSDRTKGDGMRRGAKSAELRRGRDEDGMR